MEISRKKKMFLIAVAVVLATAMLGVSVWLIVIDTVARNINLISVDVSNVSNPSDIVPEEFDIAVSDEVTLHYAVCGQGKPVILVHGNGNSNQDLRELMLYLAKDYRVYAPDSRCQGKSTVTEKVSYQLMASDLNGFIAALGLEKPYVIGHSDGGIIAIQTAIDYPQALGAFVACGANSAPDGLKFYFTSAVRASYKKSGKELDRIMIEEPDFTVQKLNSIVTPAYILAGEFDIVKLSDTAFLADNIPNSKVAVIKWAGHSSYIKSDAKKCYVLSKEFFEQL